MSLVQEEELIKLHKDLCVQLNLEEEIVNSSWEKFLRIYKNFTLEGELTYWIGCAIFEACQTTETHTVDHTIVKGNCVNLTSLLRYSNLSFAQFFSKITKWIDMANLSNDFKNKITHLKETFGVAYNTFNEFHQIYTKIFQTPDPQELDQTKQHRNRKQKPLICTSSKIFEFVWDLYILLKMDDPKFSTDLTKSYHLLYSCIDLAFKNSFMAERRDILNCSFSELPDNWSSPTFELPAEAPCLIKKLCKCDSLLSEALHNKTYVFKDRMQNLIQRDILSGANDNLTGLFDATVFESNLKNLTKSYEMQLLSKGGFDERIFIAEYRRQLLEQQQQTVNRSVMSEQANYSTLDSPRMPPPGLQTPLTGRNLVGPRNGDTEALTASKSIACLYNIVNGRRACASEKLNQLFESCKTNPKEMVERIVSECGKLFLDAYSEDNPQVEDVPSRLQLATRLFYKFIENILVNEKTLRNDIPVVSKEVFYKCTLGCALEIVMYVYDNHRKFPWILNVLKIEAYDFVKVIELIVRPRESLSRDIIKHLIRVEETILESVVWKSGSILWNFIAVSADIPKFIETARPDQISHNGAGRRHPPESPQRGQISSATEAFQSPVSNVSRQLFPVQAGQSLLQRPTTHLFFTDTNGQNRLIPIVDSISEQQEEQPPTVTSPQPALPPRRTGSLAIFFRKFYNLAGERLDHLCANLKNQELKPKIWTIFEDSIINHTELMKDRHLDQLLMCAVYVIAKVCKENIMFTDVMKCYRNQPQAESDIYRNVLLEPKKRETKDGEVIEIPEKRGDLISFYNNTYVNKMKVMAPKFAPTSQNANLMLSPSPVVKRNNGTTKVQLVGNVFIKPMDIPNQTNNQNSGFCYYFNRSPSKELLNINLAINNVIRGKRLLIGDEDLPPTKRTSSMRKIQSLVEERKSQNS